MGAADLAELSLEELSNITGDLSFRTFATAPRGLGVQARSYGPHPWDTPSMT
jgi:hypothetical protein